MEMVKRALDYAALGWAVLPLHSIEAGKCTCGYSDCTSSGKHPRNARGLSEASADVEQIREWWSRWPNASIGIATGEVSDLWVLDLDGAEGIADWERVCQDRADFDFVRVDTGGGGRHLYFRLGEASIRNRARIQHDGAATSIDVRGTGGYVVAPPSPHASGVCYEWVGLFSSLPEAPEWLIEWVTASRKVQSVPSPTLDAPSIPGGTRERAYASAALRNACKRVASTPEGARHNTLLSQSSIIGGYVVAGHLTRDEAESALVQAGLKSGQPLREVTRTVSDGLTLGADTPRHPPLEEFSAPPRRTAAAADAAPVDRDAIRQTLHRAADKYHRDTGERVLGLPKATLENVVKILEADPEFSGRIRFNLFSGRVLFDGEAMTDAGLVDVRHSIDLLYRCSVPHALADHAVLHVARKHAYDPLVSYLDGLTWDGIPRVTRLLADYFGADDTDLNEIYSARWLVACVARAFRPGCKADLVLVLQGPQDAGKSRAARMLAVEDEWFLDQGLDIRSKDGALALEGKWIVELPELEGIGKRDVEQVKAFLTRQIDHVRRPYDRISTDLPRRCMFIATTNEVAFLRDPTGSRRFAVVGVGSMSLDALKADRSQIWAEAVAMYRAGVPWHLDTEETRAQRAANDAFEATDPWVQVVERWIDRSTGSEWTSAEILQQALGLDGRSMDRSAQTRLGHVMQSLGWERTRQTRNGVRAYIYTRPLHVSEVV